MQCVGLLSARHLAAVLADFVPAEMKSPAVALVLQTAALPKKEN